MLRYVAGLLGIVVVVLGLYAQAPLQNAPPAQLQPEGKLTVKVIEKGTKLPVERVNVEIVAASGTQQGAQTNAEGQFQIALTPGTYRLTLRRQGDRGGNIGIPTVKVVNVERGENKSEIDVPPTGEITGHVVDSRGEPVPDARVTLLLRTYEVWSNKPLYQNTPLAAQANDVGEFRITEVPDGIAFYLFAESIAAQGVEPYSTAAADPALRRPINASTFYPSSVDPNGGQSVTLSEGERRDRIDIRMVRSQSYCAEDIVVPGPINPAIRYTIQVDVMAVGGGVFNDIGSYRAGRRIALDPQSNKARVCGLWPGAYRFTVQSESRVPPQRADNAALPDVFFGSGEFVINDRDINKLAVSGSPIFDAQGEIEIDGIPPAMPIQNRLRIAMVALTPTGTGTQTESSIPGKFVLKNRNTDRYFLRFQGYPTGWYIKNVMYDIDDLNLRVNRFILDKPNAVIRVVLGQNGAKLKVKVTNDKGEPVMGKRVIVVRAGLNEPPKLVGQMLTSYSDSTGECSTWTLVIEPPRPFLAPGDYYVLATDIPYNQTADVLDQIYVALQQSGKRVSLTAGGTAELTIKPVVLR